MANIERNVLIKQIKTCYDLACEATGTKTSDMSGPGLSTDSQIVGQITAVLLKHALTNEVFEKKLDGF